MERKELETLKSSFCILDQIATLCSDVVSQDKADKIRLAELTLKIINKKIEIKEVQTGKKSHTKEKFKESGDSSPPLSPKKCFVKTNEQSRYSNIMRPTFKKEFLKSRRMRDDRFQRISQAITVKPNPFEIETRTRRRRRRRRKGKTKNNRESWRK